MSLIMDDDDDQYMEDLFGDSEQVHVPIATAIPAVKGLGERLDELAGTGCCQKISWSRFGSIASISSDGHNVDIYNYLRDARGNWNLSKPIPLPLGPNGININPIVHVSWSHMGNVLAAVDSRGRLSLYIVGYAQGSLSLVRQNFALDPDNDMHAVVGLHWLPVHPQESKFFAYWGATQSGSDWNYRKTQSPTPGPRNPVEAKTCIFTISRSGLLRMLYGQRDGSWPEVSTDLEPSPLQVDTSFTHASFTCIKDESLALAVYDVNGRIRTYQININWGQQSNQKEGKPNQNPTNPTLQVKALQTITAGIPSQTNGEDPTISPILDSSVLQLTHFELLPNPMEHHATENSSLLVLAVFTAIPSRPTSLLDATSNYHQNFSILCRWKLLRDFEYNLSSCFDELAARKKSSSTVSPRKAPRLEKLPDVQLHAAVTSISPVRNGTILAFRLSDGTIQYRHFDSFNIVSVDGSQQEVQSMPQAGFSFPINEKDLHVTFSPSHTVMGIRKEDGVVELKPIEYSHGPWPTAPDNMNFGPMTALLAMQLSNSILQYRCSDDLIAFLPKKLNYDFYSNVIYQTVKALQVEVDFVMEKAQQGLGTYFRNPSLSKILSVQNILGTNENGTRNLQAKYAWMTLNLRLNWFNLANLLRHNEALRPEAASALTGLVKYSMDFLVYILQELFDMFYRIRGKEGDRDFLQKLLHKENSPALILLLASFTRVLLRMICPPLRHGLQHAVNGAKTATSPEHKACYAKFAQVFQTSPLTNIRAFEQFLGEVDTLIRKDYAQAKVDEQQRKSIERDLFWKCTIPDVLMPAVKEMLTSKLRALIEASDPGKIHVHDISWLNFTDDKRTKAWNDRIIVDAVRKIPLSPSVKLRRCPRCASVMEDLSQQQLQSQPPWIIQNQKNCVCGSNWVVAEQPPPLHQSGTGTVVRF